MDFNLGGTFSVDRFALWNLGGGGTNNVVGFTLLASPDNTFATTTNLGSFTADPSGSSSTVPLQVFSFAATSAQIRPDANHEHQRW
ncbi:MAG: hypothetical protein U0835_21750 [Isosphaeraceae bacterium]